MKFSIGDRVRFLNEKGEGIVTKFINKTTIGITIEDGFEIPYLISELVAIHDASEVKKIPEVASFEPKKNSLKKKIRSTSSDVSKPHVKNNPANKMEIDLHIEELMDDYKRMSNAEIIQAQLRYFQKALDKAINNNYRSLTVIHGVGNGRLKQEVRNILSSNNIQFHDASYAKYGFGATEILIS